MRRRGFVRDVVFPLWLACVALQILPQAAYADDAQPTPVAKGQHVYICGHSFEVFIEKPLAVLAKEAGYTDHVDMGVSFIGGSTPMQHWQSGKPQAAINTGQVEVLTLAPLYKIPEEGIDKFADLAIQKNPNVRVLLQLSWVPFDGHLLPPDAAKFENKERDKVTLNDLSGPTYTNEIWSKAVRDQAAAINKRHGKEFVFVVPVNAAVTKLREMVVRGEIPGIKKQSDLFGDAMGHPKDLLQHLVTYCWFAAIYHKSPEGLKSLEKPKNIQSQKLEDVFKTIAWNSVLNEPMSGVQSPK